MSYSTRLRSCIVVGVAVLLAPALAFGAGFALFEHGARGMALGGAFGATADDPTALYFNPAGLAFLEGTQVAGGVTLITEASKFTGANPYPGQGYTTKMKDQIFYPMHVYATGKIGDRVGWGVGVFNPFGLGTWWPDTYAGRFISKRVDLRVFDLNPNLAFKIVDGLSLAVGADYYYSNLSLTKSVGVINPYTQSIADVGQVHLKSDYKGGWGWNAALLAKPGEGVSFGLTFRSGVKVEYTGATASFRQFSTGYPDFDAIVAGQIPFGRKVAGETYIRYPWEARAAVAWHGNAWGVEADVVRQGWKSFKELPITLPDYPLLSSIRPENYEDSNSYRVGVEYTSSPTLAWQFGAVFDETPVPVESVSPLLPDANRYGLCVGMSWKMTPKTSVDVGFMHLKFAKRSTKGINPDQYEGTYRTRAELLGFSIVHRF